MNFPIVNPKETLEQSEARLAESPEGSTFHQLSKLPVTIDNISMGQIIEVPQSILGESGTLIVTPLRRHARPQPKEGLWFQNHATWDCQVIGGENICYPPGFRDISLDEAALVRGIQIILTSADQVRQLDRQAV